MGFAMLNRSCRITPPLEIAAPATHLSRSLPNYQLPYGAPIMRFDNSPKRRKNSLFDAKNSLLCLIPQNVTLGS
jgi:hypothetical protein